MPTLPKAAALNNVGEPQQAAEVSKMDARRWKQLAGRAAETAWAEQREQHRQQIERAIDNLKRTELDKWFRRQFYRETARSKWSPQRRKRAVRWARNNRPRGWSRWRTSDH